MDVIHCSQLANVDGLQGLGGLAALQSLTLSLMNCSQLENVDGLKGLSGLRALQSLKLLCHAPRWSQRVLPADGSAPHRVHACSCFR